MTDPEMGGINGDRPTVRFTIADGVRHEIRATVLVGAAGSRSMCRSLVPEASRKQYSSRQLAGVSA